MTNEERDEFENYCRAAIDEDPEGARLEKTALRVLKENEELRTLLRLASDRNDSYKRLMQVEVELDDANKQIVALLEAKKASESRVTELEEASQILVAENERLEKVLGLVQAATASIAETVAELATEPAVDRAGPDVAASDRLIDQMQAATGKLAQRLPVELVEGRIRIRPDAAVGRAKFAKKEKKKDDED
jgi:hypothetical protein